MLVLEMGIAPGYVLDCMEVYEINALFANRHLRVKESWEQSRMNAFVTARCAGAQIKNVRDIFTLPWDKEDTKAPDKRPATEAEFARLKGMAQYIIEKGMLGIN